MKIFGLIGKSLQHSHSPEFFNKKFVEENIDAEYRLFEMDSLAEFPKLIEKLGNSAGGFNVTFPYKIDIIPYLDQLDDSARKVGAVNTIAIQDGRLIGYNTDVSGFLMSLKPMLKQWHQRALICGTGGAAKAISAALDELGIQHLFISRNPEGDKEVGYHEINENAIRDFPLIINATPLGTHPNTQVPNLPYEFLSEKNLLYDLAYQSPKTPFCEKAIEMGAQYAQGSSMLYFQAEKAWGIWHHQISGKSI